MPARAFDRPEVERAVATMLVAAGEDLARPGLVDTPRRVAELYAELLGGARLDPVALLRPGLRLDASEPATTREQFVLLRDIRFHSLCEHHLLPFFGAVHVAYVPGDALVGLSRLTAAVRALARRLQLQERLTEQLADALEASLQPCGVAVMVEAEHLCVSMRDPVATGARLVTTSFRGALAAPEAKTNFFAALGHPT